MTLGFNLSNLTTYQSIYNNEALICKPALFFSNINEVLSTHLISLYAILFVSIILLASKILYYLKYIKKDTYLQIQHSSCIVYVGMSFFLLSHVFLVRQLLGGIV